MTEIVTENHEHLWNDGEGVNWDNMRTVINIPSGVWGMGGFGRSGYREAVAFLEQYGYVDNRPPNLILLRKKPFPPQDKMAKADYRELATIVHELDPEGRKDQGIVLENLVIGFQGFLKFLSF